jgi:hypothetical protein
LLFRLPIVFFSYACSVLPFDLERPQSPH